MMVCIGICLLVSLVFFLFEIYRLINRMKFFFEQRQVSPTIEHSNETMKVAKMNEGFEEVDHY